MHTSQLLAARSEILEQYAQVHAELDVLKARRASLKNHAATLLQQLREVTAQINQLNQPQPAEADSAERASPVLVEA